SHLHAVPAVAHDGRVPGHRHRPRHLQESRRAPRRPHLGHLDARRGQPVPHHATEEGLPMTDGRSPIEILLVEDNPGDERLTREALKEGKVYHNLHWAKDGVEAMDFLYRRGKWRDAPRPDIILLDLNLPKKDGREVLQDIK